MVIKVPSLSSKRENSLLPPKSTTSSVKKVNVRLATKHILPSTGGSDPKEIDTPTSSKLSKLTAKKSVPVTTLKSMIS